MVWEEEFLRAKSGVRAAEYVTFLFLAGGEETRWCSGNLVLSLKLRSSRNWVGALVPTEELKDILLYICEVSYLGSES